MFRIFLFATILALSAPAVAQENPSFDCAAAESSAEKLICEDANLAALDLLVAERYTAALKVVQKLDAGADKTEKDLRSQQRGWVGGRDECGKSEDLRSCVEWSYQRREGELVAQWMLDKPVGVTFWKCAGNPANEVVTHFFQTTMPSVRIERGDRITTGSLSRSGSGSRYDADFGEFIWIKGDEAQYREPDPAGTEFKCVVRK